ncbi:hypothetical protein ACP70R_019531 [Stipagrostis hirtigluma subsp. patula]
MMVYRGKTDGEKAEGTKQSFAVAATLEGALAECSKGKPFFGGDSVGYVDVALGSFVAWVHAIEKLYGGVLQGEALLWRRQRRVRRCRARKLCCVGARHREALRPEAVRRWEDPAPGDMVGALWRAGRGQGGHAGEADRARQDEAGPS